MKKSFIYLLSALALSFFFYSCERKDNPIEENEEEYVELTLMPKGIDISVAPMAVATRASSSDMYCVQVYKGVNTPETRYPYATWVTNDLTTEKFKLLKGDTYSFYVMYIPNGQDILAGVGYAPFNGIHALCPSLNDGICYGEKYYNMCGNYGSAKKKGDKESGQAADGYYLNDVDRYHGFAQVKATASVTLDVNLYRQMFELNIVANNFTEGTIKIPSPMDNDTGNNMITLTPSNPSVSKVLEFFDMPWADMAFSEEEVKNFESGLDFHIDYIGTDGKAITIFNYYQSYGKPIKRMTKLIITLDIEEILEDINAGLTPHVVSGEEWSEVKIEY